VSLVWIIAIAVAAFFIYIRYVEPYAFRVTRVDAPCRLRCPKALTALHLSDLHFREGDHAKLSFVQSLAREEVDLVFVTGDIIDRPDGIPYAREALSVFRPRIGLFVVLGGHDYFETTWRDVLKHAVHPGDRTVSKSNDWEHLANALRETGAIILDNERTTVSVDGQPLIIAGTGDAFVARADLDASLPDAEDIPRTILLTHCLDIWREIAARGVPMVFAGHSHGGQIRLPLIGALVTRCSLPTKWARGLFRVEDTVYHLNNGVGAGWLTDIRFLCRPEASVVRIYPGASCAQPADERRGIHAWRVAGAILNAPARMCAEALLLLIACYQKTISPILPRVCRFTPSCSQYAVQAIRRHGILRGGFLAAWRVLRCNPFGGSGYDAVPEKKPRDASRKAVHEKSPAH